MAVQVYTFKITYADCDNRIWRIAAVSSNYTLAKLGYMVLATFDTMAYHLFEMKFKETIYFLTEEDFEGRAVYLLLTPCPTGLISAKLTAEDGVTYAYSLYANLSQGDTPYCAYILICNRPLVKIECVPQ